MSRFDDWMRKQSRTFQEDVLGAHQSKLFREGRIQLRRFKSRPGDALTIDMMKRRDMMELGFESGTFPTVAFINKATAPLGVDLGEMVFAMQKFLDTIFVPVWGFPARLTIADDVLADAWTMLFVDTFEDAETLGFHDVAKDGKPVSRVFVQSILDAGDSVSATVCHELCEMLIDPGAQMWAQNNKNGKLYAYEVSDAVEEEFFEVDGVTMSDFVFPEFFESFHAPGSVQFDFLKKVHRPFETLPNGYQIVMSANDDAAPVFGSKEKKERFAAEDRRGHRSQKRIVNS